ncbi:MAG TPA: ROK family protein [Kofleriaceae bacterium]|nr:ROK family protein [Kofleriaceae bacterium]
MIAIGVDLGGSNLRAAAFEGDNQIAHHREAVGHDREPQVIVERVASVIEKLAVDAEAPIAAGIGIAAMLCDREGTVANSPHLRWRDVPFGALLRARLGDRFAVSIYNDVNAVTWGETMAGAARGHRDVLAVYVGTGIGGGLVCDGRLVEGARNCAGEIGHVKVAWGDNAAPCMCGSRGCIEAYAGGSYVQRRIERELSGKARSRATFFARAEPVNPSHVDQAAADGDDWALELWTELASLLAIAIGNALAITNPSCLVLGGGMLSRTPLLYELTVTALAVAAPAASLDHLVIEPAELGDDAGLVGAAKLAINR